MHDCPPRRSAFIGQGAGSTNRGAGMSQKEQKEVLQGFRQGAGFLGAAVRLASQTPAFELYAQEPASVCAQAARARRSPLHRRNGAFNVLVATCIGEEGLDIPQACHLPGPLVHWLRRPCARALAKTPLHTSTSHRSALLLPAGGPDCLLRRHVLAHAVHTAHGAHGASQGGARSIHPVGGQRGGEVQAD